MATEQWQAFTFTHTATLSHFHIKYKQYQTGADSCVSIHTYREDVYCRNNCAAARERAGIDRRTELTYTDFNNHTYTHRKNILTEIEVSSNKDQMLCYLT